VGVVVGGFVGVVVGGFGVLKIVGPGCSARIWSVSLLLLAGVVGTCAGFVSRSALPLSVAGGTTPVLSGIVTAEFAYACIQRSTTDTYAIEWLYLSTASTRPTGVRRSAPPAHR
jgi:hypothetical protein